MPNLLNRLAHREKSRMQAESLFMLWRPKAYILDLALEKMRSFGEHSEPM
jgi:hypothetical protein